MKQLKKILMAVLTVAILINGAITVKAGEVNPFADVKESDWYYPYAKFALDNNMMKGKGETAEGKIIFDPAGTMTRAEFVQVLYNIEGKPAVNYTERFTDIPNPAVDKNAWYSNAVLWAAEKGITSGKPDGSFGKNEGVTREQMAQMLMKYAEAIGGDTRRRARLHSYADDEKISDWALPAMEWAVGARIISGTTNKELLPTNSTIRAEAATMLEGFVEVYHPTENHSFQQGQVGPCCVQTFCIRCGFSSFDLTSGSPEEMLGYINAQRANEGWGPLTLDSEMCAAAQIRAEQIILDYSHNGNNTGYGENINMALSVADCYNSWFDSSGHAANMMGGGYTRMGFAWASGPDAVYFVALFD